MRLLGSFYGTVSFVMKDIIRDGARVGFMERKGSDMQIGFAGLLTIVFIVLKLMGTITWSWVWVLAPMWIGFILWIVIAAILLGLTYWAHR